eukprot:scaffold17755_cov129-Isochrysis_galbana.AAC.2
MLPGAAIRATPVAMPFSLWRRCNLIDRAPNAFDLSHNHHKRLKSTATLTLLKIYVSFNSFFNAMAMTSITLPTAILSFILTDSSSAVPWIRNPGSTTRTRHYEKFLMYGRDQFLNKVSVPVWISSKDQCADLFTKCQVRRKIPLPQVPC